MNQAVLLADTMGYRVTDAGKVISPKGRVLATPPSGGSPYRKFNINTKGRNFLRVNVHRLAAFQRFGEEALSQGIEVRHLDGDPTNNSVSNIALGTSSDNQMDIPQHLRIKRASEAALKMTAELLAAIRYDRQEGMVFRELSSKYQISKSVLSYYLSAKAKRTSFSFPIT